MYVFKRISLLIVLCVGLFLLPASAHSGGTDASGGHTDHSTGEYHYHHGYPAHQHVDGVCPYTGAVYTYTGTTSQQNTKDRINELLEIEEKYADLQENYQAVMSQRDAYDKERAELKTTVEKLEARVEELEADSAQLTQERNNAHSKSNWLFWGGIGAVLLVIVIYDARLAAAKREIKKVSSAVSQAEANIKAIEEARDRAYFERDNSARQRTAALAELNKLAKQWEALEDRKQLALAAGEAPVEPEVMDIDTSDLSCRIMARVPDDVLFGSDHWPTMVDGKSAIVYVRNGGNRYHKRSCRYSAGGTAINVYRLSHEYEPCRSCNPIIVQGKPGWLIDYQSFVEKKIKHGIPDPDI